MLLLNMAFWLEALKAAGRGDSVMASDLLDHLILVLRYPRHRSEDGDCAYDGPVAKAALHALNSFGKEEDRLLAQNRADDLIDYIVELLEKKIRRTTALVEYCVSNPDKDVDDIISGFDGLRGLKRTQEQLREFVVTRLWSMVKSGVEFSVDSAAVREVTDVEFADKKILGFDERSLIKSLPINDKWTDFKRRERLSYNHESFDMINEKAASESSDFGSLSDKFSDFSFGLDVEFEQLSRQIYTKLNETLYDLHNKKVELGFWPIACIRFGGSMTVTNI